jgi:GTP-binding protein HflX
MARVESILEDQMAHIDVLIPYDQGELVDLLHRRGLIQVENHTQEGTEIVGLVPRELEGRFRDVSKKSERR